MTNSMIYFAILGMAICVGGVVFAIWQKKAQEKLINNDFFSVDPQQYGCFQEIPYTKWYIGHFVQRFGDLFRRIENSMGQWSIYDQNKSVTATIGYSNRTISTIRAGERWISTDFEQTFAIPVKKIFFHEFPQNTHVLTIEPLNRVQIFNIDYSFSIGGKSYRLKSRLNLKQYCCDYYCDGNLAGIIARVSLKHVTIAVEQQSIDPLARAFIFDLFARYNS